MLVKKSIKAYKEEKMNCAQAILRGFQEPGQVSEEIINNARKLGGGRAEGGVCGALYSADLLAENESVKQNLHERFISLAGSEKCREIRKIGRLACSGCVELAASVLQEKSSTGK